LATPARLKAALALVLMVAAFAVAYAWRPTQHLADIQQDHPSQLRHRQFWPR
jgi:hypothetical protein